MSQSTARALSADTGRMTLGDTGTSVFQKCPPVLSRLRMQSTPHSHAYMPVLDCRTDKKTVTIDDFEMLKVLGKGTFGKVRWRGRAEFLRRHYFC